MSPSLLIYNIMYWLYCFIVSSFLFSFEAHLLDSWSPTSYRANFWDTVTCVCLMLLLPTTLLTDYMDEKLIAQTAALYKLLSFYVTTSIGTEQFVDCFMWEGGSETKMERRRAKYNNPEVHINILLRQQPVFCCSLNVFSYECSLPKHTHSNRCVGNKLERNN